MFSDCCLLKTPFKLTYGSQLLSKKTSVRKYSGRQKAIGECPWDPGSCAWCLTLRSFVFASFGSPFSMFIDHLNTCNKFILIGELQHLVDDPRLEPNDRSQEMDRHGSQPWTWEANSRRQKSPTSQRNQHMANRQVSQSPSTSREKTLLYKGPRNLAV